MRGSTFYSAVIALICSALIIACRAKPKTLPSTAATVPEALIQEYVSKGDSHLLDSHLYGWRQAATYYQKAYDLARREAIREKLLLSQFLMLTRQADEDIPFQDIDVVIDSLCANPASRRLWQLCYVATQYKEGFGQEDWEARANQGKQVDKSAFDAENSALDAYLYSLSLRVYGKEPDKKAPVEAFEDSPLFLYLNFGRETARRATELEKSFPEFAELFAFTGQAHFQDSRFNRARTYFNKALQLLPDYTQAINGLGNIYFFALEDYPSALEQYEKVLQWDSTNSAALFGKGAALHHMEKYAESTDTLNRMLASDISRKGRARRVSVRYYRGEANYYKAYNFYLTGNLVRARETIDTAKQFLPDSGEINYLSGMIYFDVKELAPASEDFARALQRESSICNAHYYLGRIHIEWKDKRACDHFLRTCSCIEGTKRSLERRIREVPSLDLETDEKEAVKAKLEQRLVSYRISSAQQIKAMIHMVEHEETDRRETYLSLMEQLLSRLTAQEAPR